MDTKLISEKISNWIKEQIKLADAKGIVLGLSGGVDSATVAALCKQAAGNNFLALILPCKSEEQDLEDAGHVASEFGIKTELINLDSVFSAFVKILPSADEKIQGNLKARLRMATLYYYANKLNYLVAGTGNKSELMVGYFTKYGDAGVDILPIADIYKTDVRRLAVYLGVPPRIIDKPPSAGLWCGQTDEDELGITYCALDKALGDIIENKKESIDADLKRVKPLIEKSEHKRQGASIFYIK